MFFRIVICLLFFVTSIKASAYPHLLNDLAVLEDKSGTLTIDEVANADPSLFRSLPSGSFSAGYTRSVFWFRFAVAQEGESWLNIRPPVLEDLRLFERSAQTSHSWLERRAGSTLLFSLREVPASTFVFKLTHTNNAPHTYYLRLATSGSSVLSATLMRPHEFITTNNIESGLLFASLAIALTVTLLSFHTWHFMHDKLTPWFIATLLVYSAHLLGISGFLQQYIFPSTPALNFYWVCASSFAYFTTFNGLYRRLFGVEKDRPILYWTIELNCWLPLFFLPVALLGLRTEIFPFFLYVSMFMSLMYLMLTFNMWRRSMESGFTMFVAMLISVVGILIFLMHILGKLEGGFFVWHILQFTALGSEIALYLVLSARLRRIDDARVSAELNASHEREHRLLQGNFINMLSHELRTSLTVLRMTVDGQLMKPSQLTKAQRAIKSMEEVIENSVKVEQLSDGKLKIEKFLCDVCVLIQEVIVDSRDPSRVRLNIGAPLSLQTDGRLLRIVIANLVDNALKYSAGGEQIEVETLKNNSGDFCIIVSNSVGVAGMPDPQRIFEKYYRSPQAHAFIGSGLGLHIAFSLAKLLDADLRYQPSDGRVVFALHL